MSKRFKSHLLALCSLFCLGGSVTAQANTVNLARGKPATQSSNYIYGNAVAALAVDGNTDGKFNNGSVTHTQENMNAWWQVDLQSVQQVAVVTLYNRTDCCMERLSNFKLLVSDNGTTWQEYPHPGPASQQVSFQVNRAARYVKVQLNGQGVLSLAEVEVSPMIALPPSTSGYEIVKVTKSVGDAGGIMETVVKCPAGKRALGWGIEDPSTQWGAMAPIQIYRSYPLADGSGWYFMVAPKNYDGSAALHVICANL